MPQESFYSCRECWHQKYFSTIVVGAVSSFSESQCLALLFWLLFPLLPPVTRNCWELEAVLGLGSGLWALHWHLGHTSGVTYLVWQSRDWAGAFQMLTELQELLQERGASFPQTPLLAFHFWLISEILHISSAHLLYVCWVVKLVSRRKWLKANF